MNRITKYVGLDVSKDKIAVAIADSNMGRSHYYGEIRNTVEDVRKLVRRLGDPKELIACYEAGPTGYGCTSCFAAWMLNVSLLPLR